MKKAPFLLLGLSLLLNCQPAFAEKVIHGRVTDSPAGRGLPAAYVSLIGQRVGTITNNEGYYQLELPILPAKIRFSSIGYYSSEIVVTVDSPDIIDASLNRNPVVLDEIVVTDEDPAVRIMREVIRKKQMWRAGLKKYTAIGYTRVVIGNGKRNVMKAESVQNVTWDAKRGFSIRPKVTRKTGKHTPDNVMSLPLPEINLYDDFITIMDRKIVGITHPQALDNYTFTLIGQRKRDDVTVYDISVSPKNPYEKLAVGQISVLDGEFAMIEAKLRPNTILKIPMDRKTVAGFRKLFAPTPTMDLEVAFEQQFDNFDGDCWLPIGEKFEGKFDLGWKRLLALPPIHWEEVTRFTGFSVASSQTVTPNSGHARKNGPGGIKFDAGQEKISKNHSVSKTGDAKEKIATVDTRGVGTVDSTLISESDFVPQSLTIYAATDSTLTSDKIAVEGEAFLDFFEAFHPTGVVGNVISRKMKKSIKKGIQRGKEKKESKPSNPRPSEQVQRKLERKGSAGIFGWSALPRWSYNRVDGHDIGLKVKTTIKKKKYYAETLGTYQTDRNRFAYDARFLFPSSRKSILRTIELRAVDGTTTFGNSPVYPRLVTSVLTLLGEDDYFDYYRVIGQSARVAYSFPKRRLDVSGAINREKHLALGKGTDYNLLGRDIIQRGNPLADEGRLGSVAVSLGWGDEVFPYMLGNQRRIDISVEYADRGLFSSDYSFLKCQASADWRFRTFFRNGLVPNTLDIRLVGIVSTGDLPVQRFGRIDSRLAPLTPYGTFRALENPLSGENLCGVFWEHNFKTVPFEIVRLNPLARRGTEFILHGASGRTWISNSRRTGISPAPNYLDRFHHEIGFSLNNIYAGLRADVTKDLNVGRTTVGIGYMRVF